MLRRALIGGILLSSLRRPLATHSTGLLNSTNLSNTCRNVHLANMETPFDEMKEKGIPQCDKPTEAAASNKEEQELPKLSASEFRVYNRMAEHMDMFVC